MDPARFDRLSRRLARRHLIRGVGGGLVAISFGRVAAPASAAPNSVPLGGPCYHDRQCINDYVAPRGAGLNPDLQIVYCADNGHRRDGKTNCCRYDGGACSTSEDCCGYRGCYGGFCSF